MNDGFSFNPAIKDFSGFDKSLNDLLQIIHRQYLPLNEGEVAANLPELANVAPDWFAISVVDVNGNRAEAGDTAELFPIQSISKPFVYGMALETRGEDYVLDRIGVEPTGESFNSIIEPEEIFKRQYNPLVNAGAIATTSLIPGRDPAERSAKLREMFRRYIGREVEVNQAVFKSRQKSDRLNRAIAYMMLNFDLIEGEIEEILALYFQQCSLMVNTNDLAVMAATLANGGVNPITKKQAIDASYVKNLLGIMYTCGLYDFSGQWAYRVGIPAKSGLSGAIIGVVPQQMGIAVFSPRLGKHKKSLRGVKVFETLSKRWQIHIFAPIRLPSSIDDNSGTQSSHSCDLDSSYEHQDSHSKPIEKPAAPGSQIVTEYLASLHQRYLPLRKGKIYQSEPGLVNIAPDWFGICMVTVTGEVYTVGDWEVPFLIQSISKVFAYGMALEDWGRERVLTKVDVEPTGDAYNSIIKLETQTKLPYNPMVNTGAIATTSLIQGNSSARRLNRVLEMYRRYIGHQVFIDTPTLVSEQNHGDRNWAISYLLRNFNIISGDIKPILDLYLQQCSVLLNCRDLAMMGATLANNGVNPITKERAINSEYVRDLLSVMYTCGMYDFAGEWVYKIGFPAKSGVSGAIISVIPGIMGLAVYSPLIDERGNSIRGIKVCKNLSRNYRLHIFDN
ncbi:glutaminase A [Myxosarcina sp. GI1]|uniref:glutaminase A n=1 Tax=Myxosarcina sp. GI1 TaxID=1541065 RepID=UPI00055C5345|nr:glutaminase A [Myxosarcina sp. GI1]